MIRFNNLPSRVLDISSRFGPRVPPAPGASRQHNGVDIRPYRRGATDDIIYSVAAGTILKNTWSNVLGWYVVIQHDGYRTWYQHLASQFPLSVGQRIGARQRLSAMGTTGTSTGIHLHFGLQGEKNRWMDPYPFLLEVERIRWEEDDMPMFDYMHQLTGDWKDAVEWALKVKLINGVSEDRMGLRESEVKGIVFLYRDNQRRGTLEGVRKR